MALYMPYCTNMVKAQGLISLAEAACDPLIKYRAVEGAVSLKRRGACRVKAARVRPTVEEKDMGRMHLVPLSVAQRRRDIKYRDEGFEMDGKEAFMSATEKYALKLQRWVLSRDI